MIETIKKQLNALLTAWKTTYNQQGQTGKILFAMLSVFLFCCLCSIPISVLRFGSRGASTPMPSPGIFPTSDGTQPTPTSLLDFDFPTLTPFPTLTFSVPSPFPTFTPAPTGSPTPTSLPPTATLTSLPTMTATQPPPTDPPATPTRVSSIHIITVNKAEEYVEIRNDTNAPVNLRGWRLVSELGNQSCALRGTLEPEEILRIWARRGNPGFDCRLGSNVWSDNALDPAVLYNPEGEEVSRFP
ncbi:MAG TPA: lamin tail domain-containing protein [Anaerolineales bacterium]|nr:lamin tail domain-containing protein [Anaerolineales bacterium]